MSGHSQFANIKHRKDAQDSKKAKKFTKVLREITVATKSGLPDPEFNPRLRNAVIAAQEINLPKDRIEAAITRASSLAGGENYDEIRYEGYAPGGIALIVEGLTDNRNRTAGEVRSIFSKAGGSLGETNSVSFLFEKIGEIKFALKVAKEDEVFEAAIEAGAEDIQSDEEHHLVITTPENLGQVRDKLAAKYGAPVAAKILYRAKDLIELDDERKEKVAKLIDTLEECDDVQSVTSNAKLDHDDNE